MNIPNISEFIKLYITKRDKSLFFNDIKKNEKKLFKEIENKSMLVIGGAGTIGSSFIRAALKYKPSKLVVVDTNENGLTELTRRLRSDLKILVPNEYITYPMSFGSNIFYKMLNTQGKFDIVANFAAHKHVRSEKDTFSIEAMVINNVLYAKNLLDFLAKNKPSHFFCVSTDKAANPVNLMGASKKLMENLIMAYSKKMKITTARFANVAFSNGSLLDGYIQRLLQRQPISCPSDVKRFFVSPEESGEICLITCILAKSGEICFPKLDKKQLLSFKLITKNFFKYLDRKIKICSSENEAKELALNISDFSPYPVYFFETDTTGEKLFEEFYSKNDDVRFDKFSSIGVIANARKISEADLDKFNHSIENLFHKNNTDKKKIIKLIKKLIPSFHHIETGKYLDSKM